MKASCERVIRAYFAQDDKEAFALARTYMQSISTMLRIVECPMQDVSADGRMPSPLEAMTVLPAILTSTSLHSSITGSQSYSRFACFQAILALGAALHLLHAYQSCYRIHTRFIRQDHDFRVLLSSICRSSQYSSFVCWGRRTYIISEFHRRRHKDQRSRIEQSPARSVCRSWVGDGCIGQTDSDLLEPLESRKGWTWTLWKE